MSPLTLEKQVLSSFKTRLLQKALPLLLSLQRHTTDRLSKYILSRFTGRAHKHEGKLIVLIVLLSWRWDLPTPYTLVLRLSTDQG
jgi:hypothetical protein